MKLSMWIVNDWLSKYSPKANISKGEMTITGVRYIADDNEMNNNFLYIGYADTSSASTSTRIICVNNTDLITINADDIYLIFNEIQQMIEFYNNWETNVLQAINRESDISEILELTAPILKTGVALTDLSHKVLGDAHYQRSEEHELVNGFLSTDELKIINEQLRDSVNIKEPYVINSIKTKDIIRNFYSKDERLIGWFVSLDGGSPERLNSRLQLSEAFCSLLDLWFKIHTDMPIYSNLFSDILEGKENDRNDAYMRLDGIGWDNTSELQLAIFRSCSEDDIGVTLVTRMLENNYDGLSGFLFNQQFVIVINWSLCPKDLFFADLSRLLEMQNTRCGFSYSFTDILSLQQYFMQAQCALEYGDTKKGSISFCEDHALDYMRSRFHEALEINMTSPVLDELIKHDQQNGTDYYNTLRVYLMCERDQTLAAKVLCIHRNSLVYRVNRLKEMIDVDLDNADERLYLILSYFVKQ